MANLVQNVGTLIPNFATHPDVEKIITGRPRPVTGWASFTYTFPNRGDRDVELPLPSFDNAVEERDIGGRTRSARSGDGNVLGSAGVDAELAGAICGKNGGDHPYALQAHQASLANTRPVRRMRRQALREVRGSSYDHLARRPWSYFRRTIMNADINREGADHTVYRRFEALTLR
ncbi:hypothetical protein B0H10DRAFT_1955040 [Mycena sp. CBHHK59/15]|nr:hypothetical protein B0H10DRAFT_1955040 [Mycena sp. CBHHK59/15]